MKRGIKVLLMTDAWVTLALGMIGPIYAIFVEKIGGDILDASWAYFAFMITSGVVLYLLGHWENKVKHKEKLITAGYALTALGCLAYIFVYSQLTLIITQIILGLGEAVLVPAWDATYSNFTTKKHAASEWGSWEAMRYIVTAFAAIIGGFLAYKFGFKVLFIIMFIISLFSVVNSFYLYKKKSYLNSK